MPVDKNKIRALAERVNKTSNADFVKRLLDRKRDTIKNPDGTVSTHELGYVTEGDHAVVFPDIQSTENGLVRFSYPESYERAVERGDTVHMSVPDAKLFTERYKEVYPGFDKYTGGGLLRKYEDGGPEKTYQDYLDEYNAARSAWTSAIREEENATNALREYQMNYRNPRGYWYWTDEGKKLRADADMAREKLEEARKNFDSSEKIIGEKTLEKYAGTAYDPMYFWDYVADTKEKANKYYKDRAIRESAGAKEVSDYLNSYANSKGYQRIRENQRQWWINRHPYRRIWQTGTGTAMKSTDWLQDKLAGLSPAGVFDVSTYPELSVMRSKNGHGAITVGTIDSDEFPYWFVLPHEMSHIPNTGGFATSSISAQKEALDQNTNTEPGHDSKPEEKHSDKEGLMFLLYKEGIYDSRGDKDATPEDIKKLREKYPKLRPLIQMNDEQAAWMINHVADANDKVDMSNMATDGGLIRRFDLGGDRGSSGGGHSGGRGEATPEDFYRERMRGSDNKWERISNARYFMANDSLRRSGASPEDAERLARILGAQSALETGWVDNVKGNNFAGYMSNGKRMTFDDPSAFWDYHISNLDRKWPGWRDAKDITEYYNIVNHPDLGLDTKEKFDSYNRVHRDNPVYIYAPAWENGNYLRDLRSVYDRYINKYVNLDFSDGGGIHIKESKKGTFTAAAKAHGKSVQAFASQVLANKDNYSPAMVKKANFARNAAKWHSDGGAINKAFDSGDLDLLRAAVNNVMKKKISGK